MTVVITTVAAFNGTMTAIRTGSYSSTTRDLFIYFFSCAIIFYYYYNIITSPTAHNYRHRRHCRTARRDTRTCGAADPRVPYKRGHNNINILTFADGGKSLASYTKRSRIICSLPTHHTAACNTRVIIILIIVCTYIMQISVHNVLRDVYVSILCYSSCVSMTIIKSRRERSGCVHNVVIRTMQCTRTATVCSVL